MHALVQRRQVVAVCRAACEELRVPQNVAEEGLVENLVAEHSRGCRKASSNGGPEVGEHGLEVVVVVVQRLEGLADGVAEIVAEKGL